MGPLQCQLQHSQGIKLTDSFCNKEVFSSANTYLFKYCLTLIEFLIISIDEYVIYQFLSVEFTDKTVTFSVVYQYKNSCTCVHYCRTVQ